MGAGCAIALVWPEPDERYERYHAAGDDQERLSGMVGEYGVHPPEQVPVAPGSSVSGDDPRADLVGDGDHPRRPPGGEGRHRSSAVQDVGVVSARARAGSRPTE